MFSLADRDRVQDLLGSAGFVDMDVVDFETPTLLAGGGSVDETMEFLGATAIAAAMFENAEPQAVERARVAIRDVLAAHHDGEGVRLGASAWVVTARQGERS
jgi:hypothetical protein